MSTALCVVQYGGNTEDTRHLRTELRDETKGENWRPNIEVCGCTALLFLRCYCAWQERLERGKIYFGSQFQSVSPWWQARHGGRSSSVYGCRKQRMGSEAGPSYNSVCECVCLPLSPSTVFPPLVAFFASQAPSEGSTALRAQQAWKPVLRIQAREDSLDSDMSGLLDCLNILYNQGSYLLLIDLILNSLTLSSSSVKKRMLRTRVLAHD